MSPSDRRHLENMQNQLEAYEAGRLDLSGLISSLEALLGLFEEMPEAWRDAFREQWGVLEEVYSVAIVREGPIESTENSALIAPALEQLRAMIDDTLRTGFVSEAVARLARDAINSDFPDVAREAATASGGLPVQWDMGGVLVLTARGEILHYDPETRSTTTVTDRRWRTAALVKASRAHPELEALAPARPINAMTCTRCNGTGKMFDVADCGVCMGAGWLPLETE